MMVFIYKEDNNDGDVVDDDGYDDVLMMMMMVVEVIVMVVTLSDSLTTQIPSATNLCTLLQNTWLKGNTGNEKACS